MSKQDDYNLFNATDDLQFLEVEIGRLRNALVIIDEALLGCGPYGNQHESIAYMSIHLADAISDKLGVVNNYLTALWEREQQES